jgi:5-methyltetrahydropteroyltriglutamate--homocysteine methyltransferase
LFIFCSRLDGEMPITAAAAGSYPKAPHEGRPSRLGRAVEAFQAGDIGPRQLRGAQDDFVEEIIGEQVRAGLGLVNDGHVRWPDVFTPFARKIRGFTVPAGGQDSPNGHGKSLRRVTRTIEWGGPVTIDDWQFASSVATVPVKQVMTGPFSLVRQSRNEHYASERQLVLDVARVLNQEAFELEAAGCTYIQFDEPALVEDAGETDAGADFELLAEAADILTNGIAATTELRTYRGPVPQGPEDFFALPFRAFGLDLVDGGQANSDLVKHFPGGRILAAGIVGGDPAVESEESLTADIRRLLEFVAPERLHVTPSCGLGSIPRRAAEAKLVQLTRAARAAV